MFRAIRNSANLLLSTLYIWPPVYPIPRRFTLFLVILLGMILPQCSDKNSAEYYREGLALVEVQDYSGAEEAFQKAIDKNPKSPDGYYGLGGIHNYHKRYADAEKAFQTVLRLDPTYVDAHYSLGYTYEQQGKKDDAEKHFAVYRRLKTKMDRYMQEEKKTR